MTSPQNHLRLILSGKPVMNDRELYMLNALRAIASYGKEARVVSRSYMTEHKLNWDNDEDVKIWIRRIAEDAIRCAASIK